MNRLLVALCFVSFPAHAGPGDHIRVGEAVIVPDVDLGMEYRTNVYRSDTESTPSANARLAPGLQITLDGDDHDFKLGGEWELRKFFFVGEVADGKTSAERIQDLDRFNDFNVNAGTNLFKRDAVGLTVSEKVSLRNKSTDVELADAPFNTQIRNDLSGGLRLSPGPALAIVPGVRWSYDDFRTANALVDGQLKFNVRNAYGPTLGVKWTFFPRTAFVLNGSYMFFNWRDEIVPPGSGGGGFDLPDSRHVKVTTGLEGQLSARVFVDALVGYGIALYSGDGAVDADVSGVDGLLATAQVRYVPSKGSELSAGFERDFQDSFFSNYVVSNSVYARGAVKLSDFRPSLQHSIRFETYEGQTARIDLLHRLQAAVRYDVQEWAALTAGADMNYRDSDIPTAEYTDWNIHLLATLTY